MLRSALLVLVAVWLALAALAWLAADRMIFFPPRPSYGPEDLPVRLLETGDGERVAVLHLHEPEASHTVLFSHGNAEDLGHVLPRLRRLREAGLSVVAWDYRGYGASTGGPPTAANILDDAERVYDHVTGELGVPPSRLIVHGRSVGSGPAVHLAAERTVAGLVVESGFTSAFRVVTRFPLLPFDRFRNLDRIPEVRVPKLFVHGTEDDVVSFRHGRRLHEAATEPKRSYWVEGAGHDDLVWVAGDAYARTIADFASGLR